MSPNGRDLTRLCMIELLRYILTSLWKNGLCARRRSMVSRSMRTSLKCFPEPSRHQPSKRNEALNEKDEQISSLNKRVFYFRTIDTAGAAGGAGFLERE